MSSITELQQWYLRQCNDEWEHRYGVSIGTLDNPGWTFTVELSGTDLESADFAECSYGIGVDQHPVSNDWLVCKVESRKFVAFGGPTKLEEMISVFLKWAKEHA